MTLYLIIGELIALWGTFYMPQAVHGGSGRVYLRVIVLITLWPVVIALAIIIAFGRNT